MENDLYKVLVLLDLKENWHETINFCADLHQEINADFHLFHVIKATDVIKTDSQLSAMRTMNREYIYTKHKLKDLSKQIKEEHGIETALGLALGNVKHEIDSCVSIVNPDIIVIGKPKQKPLKILGETTRKHVLKKYRGKVLVVSNEMTPLSLKEELPVLEKR